MRVAAVVLGCSAAALAGGGRVRAQAATTTPTPTSAALPDRLLEPTLPPGPETADFGAQVYWLHCLACHGDRGQGLTAEFRQLYPPDEQNCWEAGCHGARPYEGGFTLPGTVPAVIGGEVLERFSTAAALDAFVRATMPRHAPGSLSADQYDQVNAYLARENGLALGPVAEGNGLQATAALLPTVTPIPPPAALGTGVALPLSLLVVGLVGAVAFIAVLLRRRTKA